MINNGYFFYGGSAPATRAPATPVPNATAIPPAAAGTRPTITKSGDLVTVNGPGLVLTLPDLAPGITASGIRGGNGLVDEGNGVWLLMPTTYMNLSGKSVGALAGFFKIAPAEILVAHDELDFLPGVVKMKLGGGVGGHNGLKDISAHLGSNDYWRLRLGIGHPGDRDVVADYVLSKPSQLDRAAIEETIDRSLEILPLAIAGDVERAMHKLHTKPKPPKEPQ